MAIYGQGQMLGSGINPESFKQDYSGFANAAAMQAQGIANLGQSIGGAIQDYGKIKKQQQQDERDVQKSKSVAKAIGDLIPDLKPTLQNSLMLLDNKELPLSQRKAEADAISDILTLGIGAINNKQKLDLERSQIEAATNEAKARAANKPMTLAEIAMGGGKQQVMLDPVTGIAKPITMQGFEGQMQQDIEGGSVLPPVQGVSLVDLVKGFEGFNPKAYGDFKQTSIGYGTRGKPGEIITEEEANNRLQTELAGHAKNIQNAAAAQGITLNENQFNALTSFDFNTGRGADLINRFGKDPQQLASKMLEYTKAGGQDLPGLVKRRQIEAALFLGGKPIVTPAQGRVGFTPDKTEETYEQNVQVGGLYGQQNTKTGQFIAYPGQTGGRITRYNQETGQFEIIEGSAASKGKAEALAKAERASKFEESRQTNFIIDKANEAEKIIDYSIATYGPGTLLDIAKSTIPGTQEYKLKNQILPAIKDSIALSSLRQLKAASPTGASGLGALTEKEGKRLENMYGVLDVGGDKVTLKNDIQRLKQTAFDYIHGSKIEREKALANGDITKDQNDQVEQMYREQILGITAPTAPTNNAPGTGGGLITPEQQSLIDKYKPQPR